MRPGSDFPPPRRWAQSFPSSFMTSRPVYLPPPCPDGGGARPKDRYPAGPRGGDAGRPHAQGRGQSRYQERELPPLSGHDRASGRHRHDRRSPERAHPAMGKARPSGDARACARLQTAQGSADAQGGTHRGDGQSQGCGPGCRFGTADLCRGRADQRLSPALPDPGKGRRQGRRTAGAGNVGL